MKYPNPLNVTLRNLKVFNGLEGQGFSATMYVDGKPTADIIDDANGGCYNIHVCYDRKAGHPITGAVARLDSVHAFIKTLPKQPWGFEVDDGSMYEPDLDAFLSEIVTSMQNEKRMTRLRKTNLLVQFDGDDEGDFRTVKSLDVAKVTALCDKQFGAGKWKFI